MRPHGQCFEDAASRYEVTVEGKTTKASVEASVDRDYSSMDVPTLERRRERPLDQALRELRVAVDEQDQRLFRAPGTRL